MMHPTVKTVRVVGAFYLALVLGAPLRLIYIPSTLFVTGNATPTIDFADTTGNYRERS